MATETIADILREMRALGRLDKKSTDKIPRSLQALGLRTYADRIKAAYKRETVTDCNALNTNPAENVNSGKVIYNNAKTRKPNDWLNQLVNLINGEINHYMSQGADFFSVDCGPWHIRYDNTKGEHNESK